MKRIYLFFAFILCMMNFSYAQNIEQEVSALVNRSFVEKKASILEDYYTQNEKKLSSYWKAYIRYYQAIVALSLKEEKQEEKYIGQAIDLLKDKSEKSQEDWILLALVQNYEIKFASFFTTPAKSMKVSEYLENAEKTSKNNPRLLLVKGIQDMYTPSSFGGGKKAESYFTEAINLFQKNKAENKDTISWGYEDTYANLVRFYLRNKENEKAKLAFFKGLALFPNHYWFVSNKSKF
ncbi:MAG: hypothetical protein Q3983_06025 [Capnocytophaga sp.]|nr:hypothetical protein [Capnocytophaga sp.]